jgi:hypothetical protein
MLKHLKKIFGGKKNKREPPLGHVGPHTLFIGGSRCKKRKALAMPLPLGTPRLPCAAVGLVTGRSPSTGSQKFASVTRQKKKIAALAEVSLLQDLRHVT